MKKLFSYLVIFVLLLVLTAGAASEELLSISDFRPRIESLVEETKTALLEMDGYSRDRMDYFKNGRGWHNAGEGSYGFYTGCRQVYFTDSYCGFEDKNTNGTLTHRFSYNPGPEGQWIVLEKSGGERISVRFVHGLADALSYVSPEGQEIYISADIIQNKIPAGPACPAGIIYSMSYPFLEPRLYLSPSFRRLLYETSLTSAHREQLIDLLKEDFPGQYYTRSLVHAWRSGADLSDISELSEVLVGFYRRLTGLPDITYHPKIEQAAKNHAEYVLRNGVSRRLETEGSFEKLNAYLALHDEEKGLPGFTGVTPDDRGKYLGYPGFTGECASMTSDPVSAHYSWFHTLFHRRPYMDPRTVHTGQGIAYDAGYEESCANIQNWGYDVGIRSPGYRLYPADGMTMVPYAWSAYEAPDPFPDHNNPAGVPITVFSMEEKYQNGSIKLFDENGREVDLSVSLINPDRNFVEATPRKPLEPDSSYTIRFEYNGGRDVHRFRTAPRDELETGLEEIIGGWEHPLDFLVPFDITGAMAINNEKGELSDSNRGGKKLVHDLKYGFTIEVPEGWKSDASGRDWQEILLEKDWMSMHLHLFLHFGKSPAQLLDEQLQYIDYTVKERKNYPYAPALPSAELVEYQWEHPGQAFTCVGRFSDFAVIIHGWGCTEEEFTAVLDSFRSTE